MDENRLVDELFISTLSTYVNKIGAVGIQDVLWALTVQFAAEIETVADFWILFAREFDSYQNWIRPLKRLAPWQRMQILDEVNAIREGYGLSPILYPQLARCFNMLYRALSKEGSVRAFRAEIGNLEREFRFGLKDCTVYR